MSEGIIRCSYCGAYALFDKHCFTCRTINPRPTKGNAEMQTTINGGNAIEVLDRRKIGSR